MSAAFFFESAICNSCLFWEYLINIYKNKSAYLCVNIYLLSMIPKNCLSFMYKNKEGQKQYLFYLVIINFDFHIWEFLLSSLLSGLIFIVNKFDNKYWKARIYFTISSMMFYPTIGSTYFVKTQTYVALFCPHELSIIFWGVMYLELSAL